MNMKINILKNNAWKWTGILTGFFILALYAGTGCHDHPIDEDNLLITDRAECYVSNFELLGVDNQTVRASGSSLSIDTVNCKIDVIVNFGTDLKNVYPVFSLVTDAKLDPKVTGYVDFSSLSKQWTVISGNRKIRKTYTVNITVQKPN
jgi:hypothetical protein